MVSIKLSNRWFPKTHWCSQLVYLFSSSLQHRHAQSNSEKGFNLYEFACMPSSYLTSISNACCAVIFVQSQPLLPVCVFCFIFLLLHAHWLLTAVVVC